MARVSKDGACSEMSEGAWLYILRCADGSYYVGTTRSSLELRTAQHNAGTFGGYTKSRRPSNSFSRSGSTALRTPSKMSESSSGGAAQKKRHSCVATWRPCSNWRSANQFILRDARLRRAPQDEGLSKSPTQGQYTETHSCVCSPGCSGVPLPPTVKSRRFRGDGCA